MIDSSILIDKLRNDFDFVIIDMPPLNIVIDGAIVTRKCDGVVLVVQANQTSYRMVAKCKNELEYVGAEILGVVLNKTPIDRKKYYITVIITLIVIKEVSKTNFFCSKLLKR